MQKEGNWIYLPDRVKREGVNIMLLGNTGAGKSASGNTILGGGTKGFQEAFSHKAVTLSSRSASIEHDGLIITVMDTVGLSDVDVKISEAQNQIVKMLNERNVDVFLLVIKVGDKFTEFESNLMKWIRENFGAKVFERTIVLFSHVDQLYEPIERYVHQSKTLQSILNQCFGRYHVFNNKDKDRAQVGELLDKIKKMRMLNGEFNRYTKQDYGKTQVDLQLKESAGGCAILGIIVSMIAPAVAVGKAAKIGAGIGGCLILLAAFLGLLFLVRKCLF